MSWKLQLNFLKFSFYGLLITLPLGTNFRSLLYLSDIFLVLFLFARISGYRTVYLGNRFSLVALLFFAALSTVFAFSAPIAAYGFVRLCILVFLTLSLARNIKAGMPTLKTIAILIGSSAVVQSLIAFFQFLRQSDLGLRILGESILGANISGVAEVVINGGKLMRAYGTFPHPNVLAAFLILGLISLYCVWFNNLRIYLPAACLPVGMGRQGIWNLFRISCFGFGIFAILLGLLLTFSRTAWVIAAAATLALILYCLLVRRGSPQVNRQYRIQGLRLLVLVVTASAALYFNFQDFIVSRARVSVAEPSVQLRLTYNKMGVDIIKNNPAGVGIGNQVDFSAASGLYEKFGLTESWQRQPIHNLYLLVGSEIGIFGLIAFAAFLFKILLRAKNIFPAVMLLSLLAFGLTDHFLWTIQQGRLMLWLVVGIVMGVLRPLSSMDRISPSEGGDAGSIPAEGTIKWTNNPS